MTDLNTIPPDWDNWLAAAGLAGSFTQSALWAAIHRAVNEALPYVVEVFADDGAGGRQRVAGALFGLRPPPQTGRRMALKMALAGEGRGVLECIAGPVLADSTTALVHLDAVLVETDRLARTLGIGAVRFSGRPPAAQWPEMDAVATVFARFGYAPRWWETALVDLSPEPNALLKGFRQSARKGIRRCRELGIEVVECTTRDQYIAWFSRPLLETRAAIGQLGPEACERAEKDWWHLVGARHYRYFVAKRGDQVLGMLGTYRWAGLATEIMSERTVPARKERLPVQDLLHWTAFLAHRMAGDRLFDLAGFAAEPSDDKEKGIRRFKEKWRGRTVAVPTFERRTPSPVGRLAQHLRGN